MSNPVSYQEQASQNIQEAFQDRSSALILMAAGLDRLSIAKRFMESELELGHRSLFIFHTPSHISLSDDYLSAMFYRTFPVAPGTIYSDLPPKNALPSLGSWQISSWERFWSDHHFFEKGSFDSIIFDEPQPDKADLYRSVLDFLRPAKILALAMPWLGRDLGDVWSLRSIFGPEILNISWEEAMARAYLQGFDMIFEDLGKERSSTSDVLPEKALSMALKKIQQQSHGRKIVVFCKNIEQAYDLDRLLDRSAIVDWKNFSNLKNRQAILDFQSGQINCLLSPDGFSANFDFSQVDLLVFLYSQQSKIQMLQQIGLFLAVGDQAKPERKTILGFLPTTLDLNFFYQLARQAAKIIGRMNYHKKWLLKGGNFSFIFTPEQLLAITASWKIVYPDWQSAAMVCLVNNLQSSRQYCRHRARYDPRLPDRPRQASKENISFLVFCGLIYPNWRLASLSAIKYGWKSYGDYNREHKVDPYLPSRPDQIYPDWPGWYIFLGRSYDFYYSTWQEASAVCQENQIKSSAEYQKFIRHDPRLPSWPPRFYDDWPGWGEFLHRKKPVFYLTWQEASAVVMKNGIKSLRDYQRYRQNDPKLPKNPSISYPDFPGWTIFWGDIYATWQEASAVCVANKVKSASSYQQIHQTLDGRLPCSPDRKYPDFPGWQVFLDRTEYLTWQEASAVIMKNGIKSLHDYKRYRQNDPKLPKNPSISYPDFPGWTIFWGEIYATWQEASAVCVNASVKSKRDYHQRYQDISRRLPSLPSIYPDWPGWNTFLGKEKISFYPTLAEAKTAAIKLWIRSSTEYKRLYKNDPRLPSAPFTHYPDWPGWLAFLDRFYPTWQEASRACVLNRLKSSQEYNKRYAQVSRRLPSNPQTFYPDWPGWRAYLGKPFKRPFYPTWQEASAVCVANKIKGIPDYGRRYKSVNPEDKYALPANPDKTYLAWPGWSVFLGKRQEALYTTWQEASAVCAQHNVGSFKVYTALRKNVDSRLPSRPQQFYADFPGWDRFWQKNPS